MYMKASASFTGRDGRLYDKPGEVEQCDIGLALRNGWIPAPAPSNVLPKVSTPLKMVPR